MKRREGEVRDGLCERSERMNESMSEVVRTYFDMYGTPTRVLYD